MSQSMPPVPPTPEPSKPPDEPAPSGRPSWKGWVILALILGGFWAWQYAGADDPAHPEISYTQLYRLAEEGKLERLTLRGPQITGKLKQKETLEGHAIESFKSMLPGQDDKELLPLLRSKGVEISVKSEEQPFALQLIVNLIPFALIIGLWVWFSRRASRMLGSGNPFGAGGMMKGKSHRFEREGQVAVTFDDVAGLAAAKQDLREVVEFLRHPEHFRRLGGKVPRGILLVGPPGTGKTLLARAVAGEAKVPFFSINGSEFIELFVGVGAARVRELFEEAKKVAPAILFIDEIDAVGRSRGAGMGGGHDEREQTLNQLLSEMDGFSRNDLTIVLAATNRPDVLDSALLRPGRFDRRVMVDRPECGARRAILTVHTKDKPLSSEVDLDAIAKNTPGFSGADLANLVNEAALGATRRGADAIEQQDFSAAYDKIVLGDPRETKLDPAEKQRVAVHEAGHAVLAHFTPGAEPPERVTIIPRGMALGVTQQTPGVDRHLMTRAELSARLQVLMAGYAAESVVFGDVSSGAANDLQKATDIAFNMVAHFGMSERVGPVYHEHRTEHPFLGQRLAVEGGTSDATVHVIEEETRRFLNDALEQAKARIGERRVELDALVAALMDDETLERKRIEEILGARA
ncbi:MAG: ATP-dependent zinc metalloprotease FtsH [Myxococcales bacterium]|nr:ATP-dependent zinc metalloprotease FtsH [Myxococcales bacterium]